MRRGLVAGMLVAVAWGCSGDLRADEQVCEEATAWLDECCEGFPPEQVSCRWEPAGCSGLPQHPNLDIPEGECILDRSCEALIADGVCERALTALRAVQEMTDGGVARGAVKGLCP